MGLNHVVRLEFSDVTMAFWDPHSGGLGPDPGSGVWAPDPGTPDLGPWASGPGANPRITYGSRGPWPLGSGPLAQIWGPRG